METSLPRYLPQLSRLLSGSKQPDVGDLQPERPAIGRRLRARCKRGTWRPERWFPGRDTNRSFAVSKVDRGDPERGAT
jgi:hypothetical protein